MNSSQLRQKFLNFFRNKDHAIIGSASLIPEDTGPNQKTFFITAGMQPLVPFLLGQEHPKGKRLANVQKCIRTGDIDEVGDDTHLTFFEMLGNWSLGDYWKKESINWSFEFLTQELNIPLERLAVSCFAGDANAPKDEESAVVWESLRISKERIAFLPKEDNWWGPVGDTGPCGPDTEIFYWKLNDQKPPQKFDLSNKNWVEVWNNVFMQYVRTQDGKYILAEQKNVDTGMGLERTLSVLNGYENVYETDLFRPIISKILSLAGIAHDVNNMSPSVYPKGDDLTQEESVISVRVMADHIKAAVFLISDGIVPSNKDSGYILRRLIRRTITRGKRIGITKIGNENFLAELAEVVIRQYMNHYHELKENHEKIITELDREESKFRETLIAGLRKMEDYVSIKENMSKFASRVTSDFGSKSEHYINLIPGKDAFDLYQTYGFPPELLNEELSRYGMGYHKEEFEIETRKHQQLSKTSSAGMFKGGLADHKPETIKLHTAHHLLLAALQQIFGKQVKQRGSNINSERLRIDFSFDRKLTDEEKKKIEDIVNKKIKEGLDVFKKEMPKEEAEKIGAEMEFGVKYGNTVSVYSIEDKKGNIFSKEFCGGPHVKNTSELGKFKIIKEEAVSSGVRRIKAILD